MSSKQTVVIPNRDEASVNVMPYTVIVGGKPEDRIKAIRKVSALTGEVRVELTVPMVAGLPLVSVSTLDAVARRITPTARIAGYRKGSRLHIREYAV